MAVRIEGLVKFMHSVRDRLKFPLSEVEAEDLRRKVQKNVDEVRRLCRRHLSSPARLPLPSRRAFKYLESLDIREGSGGGEKQLQKFSIRGLRPAVKSFLNQLAAVRGGAEAEDFMEEAATYLTKTARLMKRRDSSFKHLPVKEQRLLVRLQLYLEDNQLERFPENGAAFTGRFEKTWNHYSRRDMPFIEFIPSNTTLWRTRHTPAGLLLRITDLFLLHEPAILRELAEIVAKKILGVRVSSKGVKHLAAHERVIDFQQQIENAVVQEPGQARGVVYDLGELFERINEQYFAGQLEKGGLSWTRNVANCRTGYYLPLSGEIYISTALDDKKVPAYVVEFVLYHEMLHKQQGADILKPGKRVHTKRFKELERQFEFYEQAEAFLHKLARGRLG